MLDLDISSLGSSAKKGLLLPRVTRAQRDAIPAPADGLLVQVIDVWPGFYQYDAELGTWVPWGEAPWRLTGNAGTDPLRHFIGTIDAAPFDALAQGNTGLRITPLGQWVPVMTGGSVLLGFEAGYGYTSYANERNVYLGPSSGWGNGVGSSTGRSNAAVGASAAVYIHSGSENASVGARAGRTNQFGDHNAMAGASADILEVYDWNAHAEGCAMGFGAMFSDRTTAVGAAARAGKPTSGPALYQDALAVGADARADTIRGAAFGRSATALGPDMVRLGNSAVTDIGGYAPWTVLSDIRFKRDVLPLEHGSDLLQRLVPITYRLDRAALAGLLGERPDDTAHPGSAELLSGFSAQDLRIALQELGASEALVQGGEEGMGHCSVDYAGLVPYLVKAVQEREQANVDLGRRVRALQQRLNELEKRTP